MALGIVVCRVLAGVADKVRGPQRIAITVIRAVTRCHSNRLTPPSGLLRFRDVAVNEVCYSAVQQLYII